MKSIGVLEVLLTETIYTHTHTHTHTSDEGVDPETVDKVVVSLLGAREELGGKVEPGVHLPGRVQESLGHTHWSVVAVVQSEPVKYPRHCLQSGQKSQRE